MRWKILHRDTSFRLRYWESGCHTAISDPVYQIVVPSKFCDLVLCIPHDECGHMGVGKTYNRILRDFFWPCVKWSVTGYIKTCQTCPLTGKLNQAIQVALLCPIPAVSQPFECLFLDSEINYILRNVIKLGVYLFIDQVVAAKFISVFDLFKGYCQVHFFQRTHKIAAFITLTGLYSFVFSHAFWIV